MINQMSSSMRNFMEAYSAVHNKEAKEEFYSHKDEISEMDFSLINQTELDDIAEEVLEELFEEGYSVEQCEAIFEEVLTEARVTYGSDTESPRAKKMSAVKSSLKGAIGKVKEKAAKGAVKSYGAYRSAKQSATDKANRLKQSAGNASAVTMRKAKDAKAGIKSGIKGMIGNAAKKVGSAANKVASKMSEGIIRKDIGDIYQAIYEKKADKDYDGDGEVESGKDEYFGSKDKAIKKAMGKKGKCEKCGKDPCECDKNEVEEGYKTLPTEKMGRQANKAYNKEQGAVRKGDEAGANKQMQRRIAMQNPAGRKAQLAKEGIDPKGAARMDAAKGKKKETEDETNKRLMLGKYSPAVKYAKMKKEGVEFSEAELEAIQAKVDAWDVEEGYQRNPEKGEAEARKSETSGQKSERNVRDRLKTMDPKKAEAMKKQMRAVGLNV